MWSPAAGSPSATRPVSTQQHGAGPARRHQAGAPTSAAVVAHELNQTSVSARGPPLADSWYWLPTATVGLRTQRREHLHATVGGGRGAGARR